MNRFLLAFILSFLIAGNVHAKNCKKGKPCGNSCIASWKTCRKHSSSSSGAGYSSNSDYSSISDYSSPYKYSLLKSRPRKRTPTTLRYESHDDEIVSFAGKENMYSLKRKKKKIASPSGKLIDVINGDTIKLSLHGKEKTIHLYGIDLPKTKQDYGKSSQRVLNSLLLGRELRFKIYDSDNYGVDGAVVFADDLNVNEMLLVNGAAWFHDKTCLESFCSNWLLLQFDAQEKKVGLWQAANPVEPWNWKSNI